MPDEKIKRVQGRKWQITINNPSEHGLTHEYIKSALSELTGLTYYCLCDEEGDECKTLHTHVYFHLRNSCTADLVNRLFPNMHRERCKGSDADNRAYILKDGEKYNKQPDGHYHYTDKSGKDHDGINYSDTFEEWGELTEEHQGKSKDADLILSLVKDGASNAEIVDTVASAYREIDKIERVRSMYRDAEYANCWRNLEVTYIFGKTGSGKTRSVMDKYGYAQCYRVTDYKHPFDTYDGQDVLIFEEFRGGIKHGDMLNYLDGYPLLLPCRYFNRQACFTKVFIITNIPPDDQYRNVDKESQQAFFRRINKVVEYQANGNQFEWDSVNAYLHRTDWVNHVSDYEQLPL